MQTIDIITTQNVTIQYALATVRDRLLSFMLDTVILGASVILIILLFTAVLVTDSFAYVMYLLIIPLILFYSLLQELLMNGQTIGKRLMGLKIVKLTGKEPAMMDYLIRWAFRFIDIWFSSGSIAVMLISSTQNRQRLGDLLGGTAVIKLNPWSTVDLKDILSIHSKDTYQPVYPGIKKYAEQDILLVRQALDRVKRYDNSAHREVIDLLANKFAEQLELPATPENHQAFLKTLVNDYVVLSR